MRVVIVLITFTLIWVITPTLADAKDRDRHDRYYGKDRDHYAYKVDNHRDHDRHGKYWKKKHRHDRHDKYWGKHRKQKRVVYRPYPKQVVYRPAPTRVIYRQPVYYTPSSYFTIGVPNLSFYVSW